MHLMENGKQASSKPTCLLYNFTPIAWLCQYNY